VRVLNCARGGIINEKDLCDAIQSGQVAGAALDVYESEPLPKEFPLRALPQVIMTPHLGASTEEAQENVGIEVAEAITDYLLHGAVRTRSICRTSDREDLCAGQTVSEPGRETRSFAGAACAQTQTNGWSSPMAAAPPRCPATRSAARCSRAFSNRRAARKSTRFNVRALASSLGLLVEETKSNEEN